VILLSEAFLSTDNIILILFYAITVGVSFGALKKDLQNYKDIMNEMKENQQRQNDLLREEIKDMKKEFAFKFDKNNKYGVRIGILENDLQTAWRRIDELKQCIRDEEQQRKEDFLNKNR
jgi:hypothetical protein